MFASHRLTAFLCGLVLLLVAQPVLAQRGDTAPAMHDRSMAANKPYDAGGGTWGPNEEEEDDDEVGQAAALLLDAVLGDPLFATSRRLSHGVIAYNRWVIDLPVEGLQTHHADLLFARGILAEHLRAIGVEVPSFPSEVAQTTGLGGGEFTRDDYLLPEPMRRQAASWNWNIAGMTASTPLGFGLQWGEVFAGAAYQSRVRYGPKDADRRFHDGAVAMGFGAGNPERLALQAALNSFSTFRSGFGTRMAVDLHFHRRIGTRASIAAGWETVGGARITRLDSGESRYVAFSRWIAPRGDSNLDTPFGLGMVTLGIGDGRFQTEDNFEAGKDGVGVFGSISFRVMPQVTMITEWTGQDLLMALSATPLPRHRLAVTAGFMDITGTAGDGARFLLGGSLVLDLRDYF